MGFPQVEVFVELWAYGKIPRRAYEKLIHLITVISDSPVISEESGYLFAHLYPINTKTIYIVQRIETIAKYYKLILCMSGASKLLLAHPADWAFYRSSESIVKEFGFFKVV